MKSDVESTFGVRGGLATILSADLVAVVLMTAVVDLVILVEAPPAVDLVAASTLLFFLPGYALVAALYPGATPTSEASAIRTSDESVARTSDGSRTGSGVGLFERLALSFGTSVAAATILGLIVWQIGAGVGDAGISTTGSLAVLTLVVVVGCAVASVRRLRRPRADRFSPSASAGFASIRSTVFGGESRGTRLLSVVLAVSVLLAAGTLGYALASPAEAEQYTSAFLLTEDDSGELVMNGYPTDLEPGESTSPVLELANHEGGATTYAVVVRIERIPPASEEVTEAQELARLTADVPAGETRTVSPEVAPEMTGDRLRLSYYVYRGEAPSTPSASSDGLVEHLYVWLSVQES